MGDFKCDNCNKQFNRKQHLTYHVDNKVCDNKGFICRYCSSRVNSRSSMNTHIRDSCKVKKKDDEEKKEILEKLILLEETNKKLVLLDETNKRLAALEAENKKLKDQMEKVMNTKNKPTNKQTNNNTININNGTINNHYFVLVEHSNNLIEDQEIYRCGNYGYHMMEKLTSETHFNPKYPQYQNVYVSNMRDPYAVIFDGSDWVLSTKKEVIDSLYENKKNIIEENLDKFIDSLLPSKKRALRAWLACDDDDSKIAKKIKRSLLLLLYNKRQIGINSREAHEARIKKATLDASEKLIETDHCTLKQSKSITNKNSSSSEGDSSDAISVEDVSVVSQVPILTNSKKCKKSMESVENKKQIRVVKTATVRKVTVKK